MLRRLSFLPPLLLALLLCGYGAALAATPENAPERLQIAPRALEQELAFNLSGEDWRWLGRKRQLLLGTVGPDNPPFDISNNGKDFDGVTADYAALLTKHMGVSIEVQRYSTRSAANLALERGEIDLLGFTTMSEVAGQNFVLSRPYMTDRTAIVAPRGKRDFSTIPARNLRIATVPGYVFDKELRQLYPQASFEPFSSVQNALSAVAYGQADIFLGDAISASFLINRGYFKDIELTGFAPIASEGVGFAVQKQNTVLLRVLDTLLQAVSEQTQQDILRRWGVGLDFLLTAEPLQLSEAESLWLTRNPKVRVLVDGLFAPLTFFDQQGRFNGLLADYLHLVELRTGIKFEVERADSITDMVSQLRSGKVQMIGSLIANNARQVDMIFSQPLLLSYMVLVVREDEKPVASLADMIGKKVAIQVGSPFIPILRSKYPGIELVTEETAMQSFQAVDSKRVDGAIQTQIVANYFTDRLFGGKLRVAAAVDVEPAQMAMGVRRSELELRDILNKVLLTMPRGDVIMLANRWRQKSDFQPSAWYTYRNEIYLISGVALLLILASLYWALYLRRQIGKRRLAERALGDQLEFMRALIDGTPHPIYVRDLDARLLECNRSYLETVGGQREEVIGKTLLESSLLAPASAREFHEMYLQTMGAGEAVFSDRDIAYGERSLKIYHWTLPFRDGQGRVAGMIGGWIDISEREQLISALQLAKEEADEASRAKSTFLATMSHEIRTPMNAIIGMLELVLKRGENGLWDRPSIKVAYDSAKTLLGLIGDILDIAKIESGKLELVPERANLRELVEAVARVFDGLARQKGLTLRTFIDANAGVEVLIDPMRFKQILSNLVSNAIKFTQEGEVTIRLDVAEEKDGRVALQLQVSDTGSGIPQEEQAKLFAPFVQASATGTRSAENGTGLGLAISRRLAQMMGGDIQLQSELGMGTQILVKFTVATVEPLDAPQPATLVAPKLGRLRVLVADDNVANRLVLCQQLQYLGHDVESAQDGREALQIWRGGSFDLVMTDCNMPVMSGYQLAREIRNEAAAEVGQHAQRCLIWGYTANAQPEEIQRCKAAGMDDCLFKPIGLEDLQRRLTVGLPHNIVDAEPKAADAVFDASSLEAMTGGNFALISRLAKELINSNRNDSLQLIQRVTAADWLAAGDVAHSIKGASTIVGAQVLSEAAAELESLCRDGAAEGDLRQAASVVLAEITHLEQSLESWLLAEAGEA